MRAFTGRYKTQVYKCHVRGTLLYSGADRTIVASKPEIKAMTTTSTRTISSSFQLTLFVVLTTLCVVVVVDSASSSSLHIVYELCCAIKAKFHSAILVGW